MQPWKQIGRYGTVGLELVALMAIGWWAGRWADGKLGTKFLALIGLIVGVYAGFRNLQRAASVMQREAEREAEAEAEPEERAASQDPTEHEREHERDVVVNARGSKDGERPS